MCKKTKKKVFCGIWYFPGKAELLSYRQKSYYKRLKREWLSAVIFNQLNIITFLTAYLSISSYMSMCYRTLLSNACDLIFWEIMALQPYLMAYGNIMKSWRIVASRVTWHIAVCYWPQHYLTLHRMRLVLVGNNGTTATFDGIRKYFDKLAYSS